MSVEICTYGGLTYSEGSEICQGVTIKRCTAGKWVDLGLDCCTNVASKHVEANRPPTNEEMQRDSDCPIDGSIAILVRTFHAEQWSIKHSGGITTCMGGVTIGDFCAGKWITLDLNTGDILQTASPAKCGFGENINLYKTITYKVGEKRTPPDGDTP